MLRISREPDRALVLEGRLTRHEVGLLREVYRAAPAAVAVLDLSRLSFVDEAGAASLVELCRRGLEIRGGSAYLRRLLEEVAS